MFFHAMLFLVTTAAVEAITPKIKIGACTFENVNGTNKISVNDACELDGISAIADRIAAAEDKINLLMPLLPTAAPSTSPSTSPTTASPTVTPVPFSATSVTSADQLAWRSAMGGNTRVSKICSDGTWGYLVPGWPNGGKLIRFSLADFSTMETLDLLSHDSNLQWFEGCFTDDTHLYMTPSGQQANRGTIARVPLGVSDFSQVTPEWWDMYQTSSMGGMVTGGFARGDHLYMIIKTYTYLVRIPKSVFASSPNACSQNECLVDNLIDISTQFPGSNWLFTDGTNGFIVPQIGSDHVVKFPLDAATPMDSLTFTSFQVATNYRDYWAGVFNDGTYGYLVPNLNGRILRFPLGSDFGTYDEISIMDGVNTRWKGGFTDGKYGYLMPDQSLTAGLSGKVVRFSLANFVPAGVEVFTTDETHYQSGMSDGTYGYMVTSSSVINRIPVEPHTPGAGWSWS